MVNRQLDALTATRGFAALMVVIFHFGLNSIPYDFLTRFFSKGNLAVSYFFTLSGFIMCYTYYTQEFMYKDYIRKRIARIVPLYLFALLLCILILIYYYLIYKMSFGNHFGAQLLLNASLLQAYIPGYALSINSPGWSLSVEMFFYLLFPVLLWLYKKNNRTFLLLAITFWVLSQMAHLGLIHFQNPAFGKPLHDFVFYHPIMHLNQFIVGMIGYYVYVNKKSLHKYLSPLVLLVLIILSFIYIPISKHNGVLAPLFMLFIVSVAVSKKSILNQKPLIYLGEISYGIYILQMPVFDIVYEINKKILHLKYPVELLLFLTVLIMVSALCYRYIEQPLRRRINDIKI